MQQATKEVNATRAPIAGFLINPKRRSIKPYAYNGDWTTIAPALCCQWFEVVILNTENGGHHLLCDEEAKLGKQPEHFFAINGFRGDVIAGRALVFGTDGDGETIKPNISLEQLQRNVTFLHLIKKVGDGPAAQYWFMRYSRENVGDIVELKHLVVAEKLLP